MAVDAVHLSTVRPANAETEVPLDRLVPGQCADVSRVGGQGDDVQRLMAMGVCLGRKVEMIQRGDPMIIRVLGSRLGVSARLAREIFVATCPRVECGPKQP